MPANIEAMLRAGIEAFQAGKKAEARAFLERVIDLEEHNEDAWLWLSNVVDDPDEKRICLENVLVINPSNQKAKNAMARLDSGGSGQMDLDLPGASAASAQDQSPFTDTSFMEPTAPAFDADDDDVFSSATFDAPGNGEDVIATSSPSSNFAAAQPSDAEYDDWVAGLGLGGQGASAPPQNPGVDSLMNVEEDLFTDGPFGGNFNDDVAASSAPRPASPAPVQDDSVFDDVSFDEFDLDTPAEEPPARSTRPQRQRQPAPDDAGLLDDIGEDDLSGDLFYDDYDNLADSAAEEDDPMVYFDTIPKDIKATRLPGEDERYPAALIAGFVLLLVMNIGAAGFLAMQVLA